MNERWMTVYNTYFIRCFDEYVVWYVLFLTTFYLFWIFFMFSAILKNDWSTTTTSIGSLFRLLVVDHWLNQSCCEVWKPPAIGLWLIVLFINYWYGYWSLMIWFILEFMNVVMRVVTILLISLDISSSLLSNFCPLGWNVGSISKRQIVRMVADILPDPQSNFLRYVQISLWVKFHALLCNKSFWINFQTAKSRFPKLECLSQWNP